MSPTPIRVFHNPIPLAAGWLRYETMKTSHIPERTGRFRFNRSVRRLPHQAPGEAATKKGRTSNHLAFHPFVLYPLIQAPGEGVRSGVK
jgi:hypothetical protein